MIRTAEANTSARVTHYGESRSRQQRIMAGSFGALLLCASMLSCSSEGNDTKVSFNDTKNEYIERAEKDGNVTELAVGKGNETVPLNDNLNAESVGVTLLYSGDAKRVTFQLMNNNEASLNPITQSEGGGVGFLSSPNGVTADAVTVSGASKSTEWVVLKLDQPLQ